MGLELVDKLFATSDFTALSEHNTQTPATFFGATPVLHLHCPKSIIRVDGAALKTAFALEKLIGDSKEASEETIEVENIDVWVTSSFLALSSSATSSSIRIDYPSIAVHGQKDDAIMLLLRLASEEGMSDEEEECVQLHILPSHAQHGAESTDDTTTSITNGHGGKYYATQLYIAIGDCQELNPDQDMDESDDDEANDNVADFSAGGWVTSENMHEFVDEQGNFRMPTALPVPGAEQPLGPGAGNVRSAPDATLAEDTDAADDGAKWQRTD